MRPHRLDALWRFGERATSLELRATMSLTRLSQRQGTCVATRPLLAEVYGWFTAASCRCLHSSLRG
jgi:hypothetical protein